MRIPGVHFAPDTCTYRGEPADFVADISLSYLGDMQLELIAPVSGESVYTDFLVSAGRACTTSASRPTTPTFDAALDDAATPARRWCSRA